MVQENGRPAQAPPISMPKRMLCDRAGAAIIRPTISMRPTTRVQSANMVRRYKILEISGVLGVLERV